MLRPDRSIRRWKTVLLTVVGIALPAVASAQLDPLLMLKRTQPNVLIVVDTSNRMMKDADNTYYDPYSYPKLGIGTAPYEGNPGLNVQSSTSFYRRKYLGLKNTDAGAGSDKFETTGIVTVGDQDPTYGNFWATTRLAVARIGVAQAVTDNQAVARFGLLKMRQSSPNWGIAPQNVESPVKMDPTNLNQQTPTDHTTGKWRITRPSVGAANGSIVSVQLPLVNADVVNANTSVLSILNAGVGAAGSLIPAGNDSNNVLDAPVEFMLADAKAESTRLIGADTDCRNTVVVLVVGGGEGQTAAGANPTAKASEFLNISSRRVPIYVVAIAPPAAEVAQLQAIAANSGGQYFEITKAMIDAVVAGMPVPELTRAVNIAVQHAFAEFADVNTAPSMENPYGPKSEFQITSPIIGTVNLDTGKYIDGTVITDGKITHPTTGVVIPQRSNVMVTTAFTLPGFDGQLRAFRVYKPVVDTTKPAGYRFQSDGRRLWVGRAPAAASRNIYTVTPTGTMTALSSANATLLAPFMNTTPAQAVKIIDYVRSLPVGPFVGSTPAIMDAPSIDPPPDPDYPGFATANKNRRTIVWVGGNRGMMHAFDGRLGVEVWAFVPFNLLPKLGALMDGHAVGNFDFFVDSSAKIADVRVSGPCQGAELSCWRTYMFFGEGPGGTFYQAFDVTMSDMATVVSQTDDTESTVLNYFSNPNRIAFKWAFPSYLNFDYTLLPYGDIKSTASNVEKTVGETWSDPAVGQIQNASGKFALITGSGFFRYSKQLSANRGGIVAGSTLYLLNVETGAVFDSRDVGNDGLAETVDNCAVANDCTKIKNALQADPVATGPPDSRFVTMVYIGDLDGRVWRFNLGMVTGVPQITAAPLKLFEASSGSGPAAAHPIFSSMATVNVGGSQQYIFFGTGSDLLPRNGVSMPYQLLGVLDTGSSGSKKFSLDLAKTDGLLDDEKVTSFPAVAGDIVFFTTTSFKAATCTLPDANLYAVTFIGGPAYDNTGDNTITGADTAKVKTIAGARATAPFIVDQHVMFGAAGKVELLGDSADYNNGVGQVGVRILSWREVR